MESSKFNMWRALFAFCQIDNSLAEQELKWIEEKSSRLPFTPEQLKTLIQDLKFPPEMISVLKNVTKPSDRSFLVDQMRVLSKIDGNLSMQEKVKIEEFKKIILSNVDLKGLEERIKTDDESYKVFSKDSFMEKMHRDIEKK